MRLGRGRRRCRGRGLGWAGFGRLGVRWWRLRLRRGEFGEGRRPFSCSCFFGEILGMGLEFERGENCVEINSERRASFQISLWLYPIQFKLWNGFKLSESLPNERMGALGLLCSLSPLLPCPICTEFCMRSRRERPHHR